MLPASFLGNIIKLNTSINFKLKLLLCRPLVTLLFLLIVKFDPKLKKKYNIHEFQGYIIKIYPTTIKFMFGQKMGWSFYPKHLERYVLVKKIIQNTIQSRLKVKWGFEKNYKWNLLKYLKSIYYYYYYYYCLISKTWAIFILYLKFFVKWC